MRIVGRSTTFPFAASATVVHPVALVGVDWHSRPAFVFSPRCAFGVSVAARGLDTAYLHRSCHQFVRGVDVVRENRLPLSGCGAESPFHDLRIRYLGHCKLRGTCCREHGTVSFYVHSALVIPVNTTSEESLSSASQRKPKEHVKAAFSKARLREFARGRMHSDHRDLARRCSQINRIMGRSTTGLCNVLRKWGGTGVLYCRRYLLRRHQRGRIARPAERPKKRVSIR